MSATLADLKTDCAALLAVLGLRSATNHGPCIFCGNRDAMSIHQSAAGWCFKCHKCGAAGSIVDAVAQAEGSTPAEAIKRLAGDAPRPTRPARPPAQAAPREPLPPTPDKERIYRLSEAALVTIFEGRAAEWLKKRGISAEFIGQNPILGFIVHAVVNGWTRPLVNAWIIRVCTPDGECVALKAHRENGTEGPKAIWLPFGTEPEGKPRHGFATFWPPPEWFNAEEAILIAEGELKAAAILSAGRNATAPTTGAGYRWTPAQAARFQGRCVCVVYDDDPAGHNFRENTLDALCGAAATLKAITFGKATHEQN